MQINKVGNETNPDTITSEHIDDIILVKNEPEEAIVHAEVYLVTHQIPHCLRQTSNHWRD